MWMTDGASLLLPKLARAGSMPLEMDGRILAFSFLIGVGAAFLSSAAPMLFLSRSRLDATLRQTGRLGSAGSRPHRMRSALVTAEVALALVVLIGAGLFLRTYRNLNSIDPGFERNGVLLANFPINGGGYSAEELQQFCLRLRERLRNTAGIAAAAYADYAPLWATDGPYHTTRPEGFVPRGPEELKVNRTAISPGYFDVLKIPMMDGRDFLETDNRSAQPVMIVNQAFARRFYGGGSPVGRRVMVRDQIWTIVGLVRDAKNYSFTESSRPHYYLPFAQWYLQGADIFFFVRAKGDADSAISSLRAAATAVDPTASEFTAAPLAEYNSLLLIPIKLTTSLLAVLAFIALMLASVGLYGVISYAVSQRTRELGIRMALGAKPREVLGMIAREGVLLTAGGVVCGLAVSVLSMHVVSGFLVGVSPFDPPTFVAASLFLLAIAAVASVVPAARATRIRPSAALRAE
jgi:predicted permease